MSAHRGGGDSAPATRTVSCTAEVRMSVSSALLAALAFSAGADLQTLSGKKLTGDLVGLDRQTVILRAADGIETRQPVADVLLIDLGGPAPTPPKVSYFE